MSRLAGAFDRAMEARERRHERALRSMARPLRAELARAVFLSACLLLDFLLPPELLRFGTSGLVGAVALLAGLIGAEAWLYRRWWAPSP